MSTFAIPGVRYWITLGEVLLEAGVYFKLPNGDVYERGATGRFILVTGKVPSDVTVVPAKWFNPAVINESDQVSEKTQPHGFPNPWNL